MGYQSCLHDVRKEIFKMSERKPSEFWITPCGRSEYKKRIAEKHIEHGCDDCNEWDDKEVLHVREVLTPETPSEFERGVRAVVQAIELYEAPISVAKSITLCDWLLNHFNLTPKDKRSDGK